MKCVKCVKCMKCILSVWPMVVVGVSSVSASARQRVRFEHRSIHECMQI